MYYIFYIKHIHTLQTITIIISLPIVLYTVISLSVESQAQGFTGNVSSGLSHVEQGHGVSHPFSNSLLLWCVNHSLVSHTHPFSNSLLLWCLTPIRSVIYCSCGVFITLRFLTPIHSVIHCFCGVSPIRSKIHCFCGVFITLWFLTPIHSVIHCFCGVSIIMHCAYHPSIQ